MFNTLQTYFCLLQWNLYISKWCTLHKVLPRRGSSFLFSTLGGKRHRQPHINSVQEGCISSQRIVENADSIGYAEVRGRDHCGKYPLKWGPLSNYLPLWSSKSHTKTFVFFLYSKQLQQDFNWQLYRRMIWPAWFKKDAAATRLA